LLSKRILGGVGLAVIGIPAMICGGWFYVALIALLLGVGAWEYGQIFNACGNNPPKLFMALGVILLILLRGFIPGVSLAALVLLVFIAMTWHLIEYEKGRDLAATDFAITVTGILYLGWIGAYLVDIRNLPDGLFWLALVFPAAWFTDMAAYFIGKRFGRHRICSRLSPKKTWEGYWGGVFFGTLIPVGLAILWHNLGSVTTWWQGGIIGLVVSTVTILGDLGESMLKRQAGVKDSGHIIPGHGGVLDRMDSWLWAGALGYLLIVYFFI
jgi:phosphatidate cytidylyltransferase